MSEPQTNEVRTFRVSGMTCLHCVRSVTEQLSTLGGVTSVDVNLASGDVRISGTALPTDDAVDAAVEEAGYSLVR